LAYPSRVTFFFLEIGHDSPAPSLHAKGTPFSLITMEFCSLWVWPVSCFAVPVHTSFLLIVISLWLIPLVSRVPLCPVFTPFSPHSQAEVCSSPRTRVVIFGRELEFLAFSGHRRCLPTQPRIVQVVFSVYDSFADPTVLLLPRRQ